MNRIDRIFKKMIKMKKILLILIIQSREKGNSCTIELCYRVNGKFG